MNRRIFLIASSLPLFTSCSSLLTGNHSSAQNQLKQLEQEFKGRIGVFALNTANNTHLSYRADERFAFCSTCKVFVVSAILEKSARTPDLMLQVIRYTQEDVNNAGYAPITKERLQTGMSVAELCFAAMTYSDNAAANVLIKILGGLNVVTNYARVIGDNEFRLDRGEPELNTAIPGDVRDTSTPFAMGLSLQRIALGKALATPQREQLLNWLRANTTGATRIRAGVPDDWQVGDKTGTGDYGTANDLAVLWPPHRAPIVLAIYTSQFEKDAKPRNDIVASTARIVTDWLG